MRGDRPAQALSTVLETTFTPHAGIDLNAYHGGVVLLVYPACADRPMHHIGGEDYICLPRMRDRPQNTSVVASIAPFTPHARSTFKAQVYLGLDEVYPHADRPQTRGVCCFELKFTPHARGSTLTDPFEAAKELVYPACAGIDPSSGSGNT